MATITRTPRIKHAAALKAPAVWKTELDIGKESDSDARCQQVVKAELVELEEEEYTDPVAATTPKRRKRVKKEEKGDIIKQEKKQKKEEEVQQEDRKLTKQELAEEKKVKKEEEKKAKLVKKEEEKEAKKNKKEEEKKAKKSAADAAKTDKDRDCRIQAVHFPRYDSDDEICLQMAKKYKILPKVLKAIPFRPEPNPYAAHYPPMKMYRVSRLKKAALACHGSIRGWQEYVIKCQDNTRKRRDTVSSREGQRKREIRKALTNVGLKLSPSQLTFYFDRYISSASVSYSGDFSAPGLAGRALEIATAYTATTIATPSSEKVLSNASTIARAFIDRDDHSKEVVRHRAGLRAKQHAPRADKAAIEKAVLHTYANSLRTFGAFGVQYHAHRPVTEIAEVMKEVEFFQQKGNFVAFFDRETIMRGAAGVGDDEEMDEMVADEGTRACRAWGRLMMEGGSRGIVRDDRWEGMEGIDYYDQARAKSVEYAMKAGVACPYMC